MSATDAAFAGSIPALYDRYMGPLLFEPYARDIAARAAALGPRRILRTEASGTGIVTEALCARLPKPRSSRPISTRRCSTRSGSPHGIATVFINICFDEKVSLPYGFTLRTCRDLVLGRACLGTRLHMPRYERSSSPDEWS